MKEQEVKKVIISFKGGMTLELSNHLQKSLDEYVTRYTGVTEALKTHAMEEHRKNVIESNNAPEAIAAYRQTEYNMKELEKGLEYAKKLQKDLADLHVKHLLGI